MGAFKSSRHGKFEVRDGGFQNLGGIPRNICGLPKVHLFSDNGLGFVDDSLIGKFLLGEVGCGKRSCDL